MLANSTLSQVGKTSLFCLEAIPKLRAASKHVLSGRGVPGRTAIGVSTIWTPELVHACRWARPSRQKHDLPERIQWAGQWNWLTALHLTFHFSNNKTQKPLLKVPKVGNKARRRTTCCLSLLLLLLPLAHSRNSRFLFSSPLTFLGEPVELIWWLPSISLPMVTPPFCKSWISLWDQSSPVEITWQCVHCGGS